MLHKDPEAVSFQNQNKLSDKWKQKKVKKTDWFWETRWQTVREQQKSGILSCYLTQSLGWITLKKVYFKRLITYISITARRILPLWYPPASPPQLHCMVQQRLEAMEMIGIHHQGKKNRLQKKRVWWTVVGTF